MRPRIVFISKRILLAAVLFLLVGGLMELGSAVSLKHWKQEMSLPGLAGKTVVIDPGHGGADPGAMTGRIREADINMKLAQALQKQLVKNGATVRLTRNGNTGLVPAERMTHFQRWLILEQRKKFAQDWRGHIFLSIHTDSNKDRRVSGAIVYYSDPQARELAEKIENRLSETGLSKRPVSKKGFTIIDGNQMPSVLIETGFITNKKDLKLLTEKPDLLANAIFAGLKDYLSCPKQNDT